MDFSADWFFDLENKIREMGADSDAQSFDEIRENLSHPKKLSPTEFADMCAYVILAGGFSQKTAKKIHAQITEYLHNPLRRINRHPSDGGESGSDSFYSPPVEGCPQDGEGHVKFNDLFNIFHNKNKINAVCEIWNNKNALCAEYYGIDDLDDKIKYLSKLPHIGKITANHLARNLGENVVKYDIWIQRLGAAYAAQCAEFRVQSSDINNGKLNPEIKRACDDMFAHLSRVTGLPIGYIDVVLWKGAQLGLIFNSPSLAKGSGV